ncbi:MAG TPA: diacylglycerol kinase family protein [Bacteroidia bacterium]|nr:diacylglycerol kinase family protein [Bacteroidia bacterium]
MRKNRIAFVINPRSGSDKKTDRLQFIRRSLSGNYESEIFVWEELQDRQRIFNSVLNGGFDIAVAVGGDGTVSQLAEALAGTEIALGIIPFGSGNGLARHLGIPMDRNAAMKILENGKIIRMDRGRFNNRSFFCTAGVGFDAHIGKLFVESSRRGFKSYARMVLREFRSYEPENYTIEVDGKKIDREAVLITVANAGQYGNNAWIAPAARVCDGLLHISILKPFQWWNLPGIIFMLFRKKIDHSRFFESFCGNKISILRETEGATHYDGEPDVQGKEIVATVDAAVLKVMVPLDFKE